MRKLPSRRMLLAVLFFCSWGCLSLGAELFQVVVVRPGDTLWGIANRYLKDPTRWNEILKYNVLPTSDPTVALPGMNLKVPVILIKEKLRAAKLIYMLNEVLYRRKESPDWNNAVPQMDLYDEDSLRTMTQSWARIRYSRGEVLSLNPNSVAVLKPPHKNTELELLQGEIRSGRARVLTASARITPKTKDTDYSARVKEDLTTLVQVYAGRAAVEAQGQVVVVPAGYGSEVQFERPPSRPISLPPSAQIGSRFPGKGGGAYGPWVQLKGGVVSMQGIQGASGGTQPEETVKRVSEIRKNIDAGEAKTETVQVGVPVQGYRLQVSGDRGFGKILRDRYYSVLDRADLNSKKLPEGRYWVRVAVVDLLGMQGSWSGPRPYEIRQAPPLLEVVQPLPGEKVKLRPLRVEGITDPGNSVTVNGRQASVDSQGHFSAAVALEPGQNEIRLLAMNPGGLKTSLSRWAQYEPPRKNQEVEEAAPTDIWDRFYDAVGGGFGLSLLVSGLVVVGLVLVVLGAL